jgi:hypothetical protein
LRRLLRTSCFCLPTLCHILYVVLHDYKQEQNLLVFSSSFFLLSDLTKKLFQYLKRLEWQEQVDLFKMGESMRSLLHVWKSVCIQFLFL